jgi:hypothetical protein
MPAARAKGWKGRGRRLRAEKKLFFAKKVLDAILVIN